MDEHWQFLSALDTELQKARSKFPFQNVWITLAALTEEIGELNQAVLQYNHEKHKNITKENIKEEALQSIVMILRVLFDTEVSQY